jgi:hypothetical protein
LKNYNYFRFGLCKIVGKDEMWDFIEGQFLPGIYAQPWYNGNDLRWREKLAIASRYGIRVGSPRIRQLRIKESEIISF